MRRQHLIVMVKNPQVGRVKTRLGRDIGMVKSAWWFRHQVADMLRRLDDPRWRIWLSVAPDSAAASKVWPLHLPRISQGQGGLGLRMKGAFEALPKGPAVLVGGDIPGVTKPEIAQAFGLLGRHDAVFGPADDGGFWLTGFARKRPLPREIFENVRWSSEHALSDSIATLCGQSYALAAELSDVDTVDDLRKLTAQKRLHNACIP
ncbi:glycosyltransferase [Lentibacter algarum]|uniref:TIGR04282 family arsenosugar biosynthesis glycosyltransferase n=1 Tax=Lentibacter algarum TaxID=576131 RepID=UPI001C091DA2|nr:TIGR04282 family arsenosugar biosynthesis glycosyltransferase [Lentibacter algarum]MBU2983073.1 glycosyltransferase [Lentibacter algarum]